MKFKGFILFLMILGIFLGANSIFILDETEQAIVTQFGEPKGGPHTTAGINLKIPFIQVVHKFDKRLLSWDGAPQEVPTQDKKFIHIDTFARWKIVDPLAFYKALKTENSAHSRLDDLLDGLVRDEIVRYSMSEIVKSSDREMVVDEFDQAQADMNQEVVEVGKRQEIEKFVLENSVKKLEELQLGISVIDFRFKRVKYNNEVRLKVFDRMISEQKRIAEKYRAIGEGEKQRIMGATTQKIKEIMSGSYKESQTIKGQADARAIQIYADAYNKSTESRDFYQFMRTLQAYSEALDSNSTIIFSTDNEFLKYLNTVK
ncbi:MAG: protease modulator HflC [Candidatus Marinimicrobia bacterium]|nr:protease modulator HflC [Candidatus Neomarinimicrobiota bacterium]